MKFSPVSFGGGGGHFVRQERTAQYQDDCTFMEKAIRYPVQSLKISFALHEVTPSPFNDLGKRKNRSLSSRPTVLARYSSPMSTSTFNACCVPPPLPQPTLLRINVNLYLQYLRLLWRMERSFQLASVASLRFDTDPHLQNGINNCCFFVASMLHINATFPNIFGVFLLVVGRKIIPNLCDF
jgi:hypothetical protein